CGPKCSQIVVRAGRPSSRGILAWPDQARTTLKRGANRAELGPPTPLFLGKRTCERSSRGVFRVFSGHLGGRRDFRSKTLSQRPLLFHVEGRRRADALRVLQDLRGVSQVQAAGRGGGAGKRPRGSVRFSRRSATGGRGYRAARPRSPATRLRAVEEETRRRRIVRGRSETRSAAPAGAYRDRDVALRRGESRHP